MWSKLKSLSKNDKKLVVIVSSVAGGLVLAVISVAIIIGITREDSDYPHIADNGYGSSEEPAFVPPRLGVPPEEWYYFPIAPTALGRINIEALSTTDFGVAVDSAFLISSETQTLTSEHLKNYLSSRCGTEFTLEAQANNTFVLNFSEEQSYNTIINLVYQPSGYAAASHAFQTTDIFRISATTPARNTHGIPPN
ncbi:MAG: hypothetical protein FWF80_01965, partial [Defluviitaleaceae bacterium]|nr:hypothetical protein [Defluviitaleaceae bacterium]